MQQKGRLKVWRLASWQESEERVKGCEDGGQERGMRLFREEAQLADDPELPPDRDTTQGRRVSINTRVTL